ncbi:AbrB/MazE/SpoVT family DNA-binding domain-containing protein [Bacillus megaterium]|nr:AbrB/MazE/SpoVT family DNA-binding domain-containing protein [Priestia megaterium]
MQYTGQSRKIDHLVRLDIPKKLREKLNIKPDDYIIFTVKEDGTYISSTKS